MDTRGLRWPKGETRKTRKARRDRREHAVVGDVRSQCVGRDGYCRLYVASVGLRSRLFSMLGGCRGPSEWAHLGALKRSRTVGMDPEERHTSSGSLILCRSHHRAYDAGEITIDALSDEGADGRLAVAKGAARYEEEAAAAR